MNERQPQLGSHESRTEHTADIFVRLRERIEEMRSGDRGKVDPEALAKKLADRAQALRGQAGTGKSAGPQLSFLAFCHGAQMYGIPVSEIIEVGPLSDYTPVPGAPSFVPGVIHWRGAIISLLDLVKLFGITETGLIDERVCLIVEATGRRLGILASDVEELYTVSLDQVKSAPELSNDVPLDWVIGVYDENRLILKMDAVLQDSRMVEWRG